jgi:hypothetical protein
MYIFMADLIQRFQTLNTSCKLNLNLNVKSVRDFSENSLNGHDSSAVEIATNSCYGIVGNRNGWILLDSVVAK